MKWEDFTEGTEVATEFRIASADMDAFERLSGDSNPLHTDAEFARTLGFEDRVVYGALIIARISEMIGMKLPGTGGVWSSLRIDFRDPLYIDEAAELRGTVTHRSEAVKMLTLRLRVEAGGRRIATGTAETVWRADD